MITDTMTLKYDIESANIEVCKRNLLRGADVNEVVSYHHNKQTPLHAACRYRERIENVKFLIRRRANTTLLDAKNKTPLDYLDKYDLEDITQYIAELERQREEERLYAMLVLEHQRNRYLPVANIGSIVTAYLR